MLLWVHFTYLYYFIGTLEGIGVKWKHWVIYFVTKLSPCFRKRKNKQNLITSYPLCPLPHVSLYIAYQGLVNTLYKGSKASVSGSVGTMGSVATAQICCYRAKATTAIHEEIGMAIFQWNLTYKDKWQAGFGQQTIVCSPWFTWRILRVAFVFHNHSCD